WAARRGSGCHVYLVGPVPTSVACSLHVPRSLWRRADGFPSAMLARNALFLADRGDRREGTPATEPGEFFSSISFVLRGGASRAPDFARRSYYRRQAPGAARTMGMIGALESFTPATRDVAARGAPIRLVEAGAGAPLVPVPDSLASPLAWEDVLPKLAARFRVIVPDLPGFGDSEKPPPGRYAYGFDTFSESLVDLVAGLGLSRVS